MWRKGGRQKSNLRGTTSRLRCLLDVRREGLGKVVSKEHLVLPFRQHRVAVPEKQQVGGEGRLFIHLTRL